MEARHQTRAVHCTSQAMARRRRDEAAQDVAREGEVFPDGVHGRGMGAAPKGRGCGCGTGNDAEGPAIQPPAQDVAELLNAMQ